MSSTTKPKAVKHTLFVKFKDDVTREQIEKIINDFTNLVNQVEPLKSLHWGTNLGIHDLNFGYTHAFETTFDDLEGLQEYLDSPIVNKFAEGFLPTMSQQFVMDYELY
ncbi:hypothetical protein Peur_017846 [Populus x canadensis]|uniref:stress-response A/B barrel domain-containing protein HS1-like n=1 Tax=Populus nigra TaxID=3691 RepID=UPI002B27024F|nr:stress-response A/B barrel domain-containing protein HS1-like [Populus nigra]